MVWQYEGFRAVSYGILYYWLFLAALVEAGVSKTSNRCGRKIVRQTA
jgi:hypothetical protein